MILNSISILNYRNIEAAELVFSDKFNCFIGNNGEGKTNLLDALYFLSFCHSMFTNVDSQMIMHEKDFFMLNGKYDTGDEISVGMKRGHKKTLFSAYTGPHTRQGSVKIGHFCAQGYRPMDR